MRKSGATGVGPFPATRSTPEQDTGLYASGGGPRREVNPLTQPIRIICMTPPTSPFGNGSTSRPQVTIATNACARYASR